jgi:hypothetical protein
VLQSTGSSAPAEISRDEMKTLLNQKATFDDLKTKYKLQTTDQTLRSCVHRLK